jgi:hypothetical protein
MIRNWLKKESVELGTEEMINMMQMVIMRMKEMQNKMQSRLGSLKETQMENQRSVKEFYNGRIQK